MKAAILLEDGSYFEGVSVGVDGERAGEIALNTAVVGYQEMMTDPANAGKILVLTYPLIGNYGVARKFYESDKCRISALLIKEDSRIYSNWQAEGSFGEFLNKEGVVAISGVDTRTLAVTIRDKGEMYGIVSTKGEGREGLIKKLKAYKSKNKADRISAISVKTPKEIKGAHNGPSVGILDLGILNSFIGQLTALGCNITLLPYNTPADEILSMGFDGLVISSGPEDDISIPLVAKTIKEVLGKVPLLGIAAGHEAIGLALGFTLKKLKVGHRGVNYPVKASDSLKGEITVQNHSFVIDERSVKGRKEIKVGPRNINDNSIEEMESKALKFISTQYYPASPGFNEVNNVFGRFVAMMPLKRSSSKRSAKTAQEVQYAKA